METTEFIVALDRDSAAFVDACAVAGLTMPVPSCPGWKVADLLWHLTEVHDFWRTVVAERLTSWESYAAAAATRRRRTSPTCIAVGASPS